MLHWRAHSSSARWAVQPACQTCSACMPAKGVREAQVLAQDVDSKEGDDIKILSDLLYLINLEEGRNFSNKI